MNEKGFNLIELIISIVVLGVIAVIAIPKISDIINSSKKNSFEASAKQIAKKVKAEYSEGNIPGTKTDCLNSKYDTDNGNYSSCIATIYANEDDAIVSVDLVGANNYAGLTIVGAKEDVAHAFEIANTTSLKSTLLLTVSGKDVDVNKFNGNGLYKWGSKYIYRGGITKTNAAGLATNAYASDVDSGTDVNNFIQVPWETYTVGETCTSTTNKCWRIMSINSDGSIIIVRDKNESNQVFDNVHNTSTSTYYYDLYVSNPTQYASYANAQTTNYGYNDLLKNIPTSGYPSEYRSISLMYTKLYGPTGYELNNIIKYVNLLTPINVCLNKANNYYVGMNLSTYSTTTSVTDTCNVTGKANTSPVDPLKNKYVRLPYAEEYLNASLESTCTEDAEYQCRSQNYMYIKSYYWTLNGYVSITSHVRRVSIYGNCHTSDAYGTFGVRPVVTLKSSVLIATGDTGTATDPYVLKW